MHAKQQLPLVLGLTLGLQIPLLAGPEAAPVQTPPSNSGDWCDWLQNKPGLLYKNPENPILQSFEIGGRFQYQAAYIDGKDVNNRDYNLTHDDYRRVRLESKIKMFQYFITDIKINVVNDQRRSGGSLDWGYEDFDEAILTFDIKKAFGVGPLDSLNLNYGRFKFDMTEEVRMSSKEIYTIERSAIGNKLYGSPNRATGGVVDASIGKWSGVVGVFSGEDDSKFIGGWNDGQAYYFSLAHETSENWRFILDVAINNDSGADDFVGYAWASAFNAVYSKDCFGGIATIVAGENNASGSEGGSFGAIVLTPYYWIVEDHLQAVIQYQYFGGSESEGVRTNSRYIRSENPAGVDVNSGLGDQLHTLYAGLNYHFCGDQLKVMGGVEYTSLETPVGDVNALTWLIGFRSYF